MTHSVSGALRMMMPYPEKRQKPAQELKHGLEEHSKRVRESSNAGLWCKKD